MRLHPSMLAAVLLSGACAGTPPATAAKPEEERPPETVWVVRFVPGPKWAPEKDVFEQPGIGEHVANMAAWDSQGVVRMGGPFLDGKGGMAVLSGKSAAEVEARANDDPAVKAGLLVPEVHPWLLVYPPKPAR